MAATLSGAIVLENPRLVRHCPQNLEFDGQLWLDSAHVLRGKFSYSNKTEMVFDDIGFYTAIIDIAIAIPPVEHSQSTNAAATDAGEDYHYQWCIYDDNYQDLDQDDSYHIFGDIISLTETTVEHVRQPPYLFFSGVATNSENAEAVFDVIADQHVTFYKTQPHLSILPIRACFNERRFKNQKPVPLNGVCVAGVAVITGVEVGENSGQPSLFHVCLDNINFLGRKGIGQESDSIQVSPSTPSTLKSARFKYSFASVPTTPPGPPPTTLSGTHERPVPPSPSDNIARTKRKRSDM